MAHRRFAVWFMMLAFAPSGCGKPPAQDQGKDEDVVLAKVGEVTITVADFEETINAYSPYLRQKYNSPEMRKQKLDEMVEFELLALEAKSLGYDKDPGIQEAVKQQLVRELQEEILEGIKLEDITDEEARAYYDAHPDKYHKPPQIRVAHVVLDDKVKAQALLDELMADQTNAVKWREAVVKYSLDETNKQHGGDMGYISKLEERTEGEPVLPDAIVIAAHQIAEVGHIHSELVEVDGKFHILKLTSTRPAIDRTFEQVRRQIQSIIWKDKREQAQKDFIDGLKKKANVKVNYKVLGEIQIPAVPAGEGEASPAAEVPTIPAKPL